MKLLVTVGDINGIGLEVFSKAINSNKITNKNIEYFLISHKDALVDYLNLNKIEFNDGTPFRIGNIKINLIETSYSANIEMGTIAESAGIMAIESLMIAGELLKNEKYDAILTLPIAKKAMHMATWNFPGQTEFFANLCNIKDPLMILCNDFIRVALATIHIPISKISETITQKLIIDLVQKFNFSLSFDYKITNPKIAILGLNPHAGENGDIGNEELTQIIPAMDYLKNLNINVEGPFPADGFFAHGAYKKYDGIFAMYHDQGLIPLKLLVNGGGVNFTAGLPILRTSPDHGTAFQTAGKNLANPQSTIDAINLANSIFINRKLAYNLPAF